MELKLKKVGHDYFEQVAWPSFSCETMRESIVPDSCADIARIIDTTALVCVTGREVTGDGRFCASGSVDVAVLYIPEKGDGPCSLRFQLPFQAFGDGQGAADCELLDIRGELRSVDTRVLNPRKVLTRADILLYPSGCRRTALSLCTDAAEAGDTIQLLRRQKEIRVVAGVREKEFTFLEELPLSPGKGGAEEVVSFRLALRSTDSKLIGSKLVVKGLIAATVLYREAGNRLGVLQQELPFSQILDGAGFDEECESEAVYRLLSAECRVGGENSPDDSHLLTLTLLLRGRATLYRREQVGFIADLYSTAAPVNCQTMEIELCEDSQRHIRRQNMRELLETGTPVKAVIDTEVCCCGVQWTGDGGERTLEIPVWARCLYLDENDSLRSARRDFTITCPAELPPGCQATAEACCRGDVMASIMPDGVELRCALECAIDASRRGRYVCVSGGETEEEGERPGEMPSLILRKIGREETLWAVAKQYRTTCRAILDVNEIADEEHIPLDRLLLIPRAR